MPWAEKLIFSTINTCHLENSMLMYGVYNARNIGKTDHYCTQYTQHHFIT